MESYTREDIVRLVQEEDVEFIRLQFTDILGTLKNIAVTSSHLTKALDGDCGFDTAPVFGSGKGVDPDLYLKPDCSTFEIFPWRPQQGKVARLICDVCHRDGSPFEGDSRYILKKAVAEAAEYGYRMEVGPECEFFLFHCDENGMPTTLTHEQAGYFDVSPLDLGENARRDIVLMLEEMGFEIEASHHESAPAQHEVDFRHDEAVRTADNIITFKLAVKAISKLHGLHATFMPKPVRDVDGSGMHINMMLHRDGKNVFVDPAGEYGLSREALCFIGGLMRHMKGMTAITNPLVNSYKRLVSGYEAPVYLTWNASNKNSLIRILQGKSGGKRIELRSPDCAANPYLALALCLRAGLEGIRGGVAAPGAIDCNPAFLSPGEREGRGIQEMPSTLGEALQEMERDPFIRETLGDYVYERYIELKRQEWNAYKIQVTDWELQRYLNCY